MSDAAVLREGDLLRLLHRPVRPIADQVIYVHPRTFTALRHLAAIHVEAGDRVSSEMFDSFERAFFSLIAWTR